MVYSVSQTDFIFSFFFQDSEESSQDVLSQASQVSDASVCLVDRLEKLNEFLAACKASPVQALKESFCLSSERTKRRYVAKAFECLIHLLETMCPGESDSLKEAMFTTMGSTSTNCESPEYIKALIDTYLKAETSVVRRQLLSILACHFSYKDIQDEIPSVTHHKYYSAKQHSKEAGVGAPIPQEKQSREKLDDSKLDHFLDFITSSSVIKDLPLGEKTLTLSTGELVRTPHVIRCIAPATIVRQYSQLCEEENFDAIGKYFYT